MKKYWPIIKDAIVLLTVSTLFVTLCNQFFKGLKKNSSADTLITSVMQSDQKAIDEILSETEFREKPGDYESYEAYVKGRINKHDDYGRTPLMWAAYALYHDSKKLADVDSKRVGVVKNLIKLGADVNAKDNDGWTALMWSAWSMTKEVSVALIEEGGADLTVTDRQGNTALMIAAQKGNSDLVQLLVAKGVSVDTATTEGKKAIDFALEGQKNYPKKNEKYQVIVDVLSKSTESTVKDGLAVH